MIEAEDLIKAREILKKEVKSYSNQGFGEVIIYKNLAKKYDCWWKTLDKIANEEQVSMKTLKKICRPTSKKFKSMSKNST